MTSESESEIESESDYKYQREAKEEAQYLDLVRTVLNNGFVSEGRGGARTRSIFGHTSRYSLRDGALPILTSKKVFTRGIVEELLWILRGSTDARELSSKNVRIWEGHTSQEHLEACGLRDKYEAGDTGPLYGFQWRHAGAEYGTMNDDYTGQGVDQMNEVIASLRKNPGSRRHVVCSWSPAQLSEMVLPPCHCLFQFNIDPEGLSCQLYQRSADVALGVPFNITSYCLLTHIVARAVGVPAKEFIHVLGNAHIYEGHEEGLREQLSRKLGEWPFPRVQISTDWGGDLDTLCTEHIQILGYMSHPTIKFPLVV